MTGDVRKISDSHDFESLYMIHFNELYRFAFTYIMTDDAEDIVQDVFIKLFCDEKIIDSTDNIRAYLYKMTKNSCINYLKHLSVHNKSQDILIDNLLNNIDYDLENELEINEKIALCLASLPEKQREIIRLRLGGKDYKEIAQILSISVGTVNTHVTRAYKYIKDNFISVYFILMFLDNIGS